MNHNIASPDRSARDEKPTSVALVLLLATLSFPSISVGAPSPSIDAALQLWLTGSPGSFHTLLSASKLDGSQGWQVLTNVTLDATGSASVQLSPTLDGSRFYKRFAPEGLVAIPPGTFVMGSPGRESERDFNETQHTVILTKGFWMGKREVTQGEYLSVMGSNPSYFKNGADAYSGGTGGKVTNDVRHPVEGVSWIDATNYCAKVTQQELAAGLIPAGYAYRLPTEAEWEYACRGGSTNAFSFGTAIRQGMANFDTRYEYNSTTGSQDTGRHLPIRRTVEVGSYAPNAFGVYDMHGNVWEWCSDFDGTYPKGTVTDPTGPTRGDYRVFRGGSWLDQGAFCRAALRIARFPDWSFRDFGFRIVLAPGR